ncbi:MAG: DUF3990 domain-containing protein [Bacteroidales bacterium]|nr:DUF3990 domain-containing protein [Bacteroidales bacterium]
MSSIIVYHGATQIVEHPICRFGRPNLDFGQGFYVTDIREQAVEWAVRVSRNRQAMPILNRYKLDRNGFVKDGRALVFDSYDEKWLRFIVASRTEQNPAKDYDYIEGGVANDRVVDTVNLYMQGLMTLDVALTRLSEHRPNNQMCLLNQQFTDKYLIFDGTESIQ